MTMRSELENHLSIKHGRRCTVNSQQSGKIPVTVLGITQIDEKAHAAFDKLIAEPESEEIGDITIMVDYEDGVRSVIITDSLYLSPLLLATIHTSIVEWLSAQ